MLETEESLRVIGVSRGSEFSPNHVDNDAAIFRITVEELKKKGCDAYYLPSFEKIEEFVLERCQNGDVLITMGAGDVVNIGEKLLQD